MAQEQCTEGELEVNREAIETLIAAGANTKARDKDGKTPVVAA
jgi:hypothetical protein